MLNQAQFDPSQLVHEQIFCLVILAWSANLQHKPDATVNYYQQAYELSRNAQARPPDFFVFHWRFLMSGSVSKELYITIKKDFEDQNQIENPFERGCVLFTLGIAELFHFSRIEKAEPLLKECIQNFQLVDDRSTQDIILKTLSYLLLVQGKFEECLSVKQHELLIVKDIGDPLLIGTVDAEIGEVLYHQGKYDEAEVMICTGMELIKGQREGNIYFAYHTWRMCSLLRGNSSKRSRHSRLVTNFSVPWMKKGGCLPLSPVSVGPSLPSEIGLMRGCMQRRQYSCIARSSCFHFLYILPLPILRCSWLIEVKS